LVRQLSPTLLHKDAASGLTKTGDLPVVIITPAKRPRRITDKDNIFRKLFLSILFLLLKPIQTVDCSNVY